MNASVLAIYIEPAPYIEALVRELRSAWPGKLDVLYVARNVTQSWGSDSERCSTLFLPAGRWEAVREVRRRIGSAQYGVLHLAGWGHPVLLGSMLTAAVRGIPVTVESDSQRPRDERLWRRLIKRVAYPALFSIPRRFLAGGARQAAYIRRYRVGDDRIITAHMTVDVEYIANFAAAERAHARALLRKACGISESTFVYLYVGRLESFKGIQDLLDAYLRIKAERNGVALLIAGSGGLENLVRQAAASLRSVHFLGHLRGDDVWRAYCASDVLVLPSRQEPWGLVVNEAMACGLPVVVSDAVGCAEDLVHDGETGLIYGTGNTTQLAACMEKLARDVQLRNRLGEAAQRRISTWTLANEARTVTRAWSEVLS